MKNEKIIESINHFKSLMNKTELEQYEQAFKMFTADGVQPERITGGLSVHFLAALETAARAELLTEKAKTAGRGAVKKTLEKILRAAGPRYDLQKAHNINGRQVVCDGFQLYRLIESVELSPELIESDENGSFDRIAGLPDAQKTESTRPVPVPDINSLTALIKAGKAEKRAKKDRTPVLYDFGDDLPLVNAEYLLNVLTVLGESVKIYAGRSLISNLYLESDRGDGMLCPVRKTRT